MKVLSLCRIACVLAVLGMLVAAGRAEAGIDTEARNAYIVDFDTGSVLLQKGGDERMPPASMSKIMTAYVVFDFLRQGRVKLTDILPVSEKAWRTGGSKMFVPYPGSAKVEDLLRGMIIQSGNDACIVLAEGLAGSESAFVELMNKKAGELGLTGSHFANVTGLPDPQHYMTAHDLATLARHLILDFPEYYHYDSEKEFTYNGIKQGNRNPLLYKDLGADGMKTGHTDEAGYGLTASVIREGRRIIMVIAGLSSMKARAQESEKLIEWAYREFADYRLVKAGEVVDDAPVWMGAAAQVPATTARDAFVTLPRRARHDMKVMAIYDGPVRAPIAKGQPLGKLVINAPEMTPIEIPLIAAQPVERMSPFGRMTVAARYLLLGKSN